jgi:hypothetical protein
MDRSEIWLDEKTLNNLKSISRKLVSPENLSLSEEEVLTVTQIRQHKDLPPHIIKHFLAKGLTPDIRRA